jgi:putative heme iron utilization protein
MNEDFIQEMQKYNTVFYKISEELSAALEKIDSLTLSNHALTSDLHLLN